MKRIATLIAIGLLVGLTSACGVVSGAASIAGTAVSVAGTVVETTVDVVTMPLRD